MTKNDMIEKSIIYFIGVTTSKSICHQTFPLWMKHLGIGDLELKGIDHVIHDDPDEYRRTVAMVKADPRVVGCLITTHKMDLYAAAKDIFDYLDPIALLCGEVSCISKTKGGISGYAIEPITAGRSLDAMIGKGYFGRTEAEVLIFGAGGAAIATIYHLINKSDPADRPKHITVVNRSQPRLDHMKNVIDKAVTDIEFDLIMGSDPNWNDKLMQRLPNYSIVINATGMGKDIPGSPVTDAGIFPLHGIAWEFNYRGDLDFLQQSKLQKVERDLTIEDGWNYFINGWTVALVRILQLEDNGRLFDLLENTARQVKRPGQYLV